MATWAEYKEETAALRKTSGAAVREVCLAVVTETYANYARARMDGLKRAEPSVSVSFVREVLATSGAANGVPVPVVFKRLAYHEQSEWVRRSLDALVKTGKLEKSTGIGVSGKETWMYNPAP